MPHRNRHVDNCKNGTDPFLENARNGSVPFFLVRVLVLAVLISGCAPQRPKVDTDERIYAVHEQFGRLQSRHGLLNAAGQRIASYPMAKAQCWMDVAFHEFTRNDRSLFWTGAMGEADRLMLALEAKQVPPDDTPMLNGAARLRDDLWARANRLKTHEGFHCAADRVACMEVHLVHAGNEFNQGGWRYANPYVRIAEDMIDLAEREMTSCAPPPKPAPERTPTSPPASIPVPASAPERPTPVTVTRLSADILFAFDRSDYASILPEGRLQLNRIVGRIRDDYAKLHAIRIAGHTDRIGTDQYNQRLSEARAGTVRDFLVRRGIEVSRISAAGHGESRPVTATGECPDSLPLAQMINCLAPDRRIEIEIEGDRR